MKFIEGSIENMHPNLRVYRVKYKSALAAFIIFVKPAPVPTYEDDCNVIKHPNISDLCTKIYECSDN